MRMVEIKNPKDNSMLKSSVDQNVSSKLSEGQERERTEKNNECL